MKVTLSTDGKRIIAVFPPGSAAIAKAIPSARKATSQGRITHWTYPLSMDTCLAFRERFGADLAVMSSLAEWAREHASAGQRLELIRAGEAAIELPRVAEISPALLKAISTRKYQLDGAGFLLEARQALLGDAPGLGKTIVTLAALIEDGSRSILVTCPRTATVNVWRRETRRWAPHIRTYVAQGQRADREDVMVRFAFESERGDGQRMLIVNTEMMRMRPETCPDGELKECADFSDEHRKAHLKNVPDWPFLFGREWDAIVCDESHNSLAGTSNTGSRNITQARLGAVRLRKRLSPDGLALALSGTPFRSRLEKSWGTLNWLRPDVFGSFWGFAEEHFGTRDGKYARKEVETIRGEAIPKNPEKFAKAIAPYYLARDKKTAAPDLPPVTYSGSAFPDSVGSVDGVLNSVWLEMDPRQAKAYAEMKRVAEAHIKDGKITATGILAEITRLRQFACSFGKMAGETMEPALPSNKLEWLLEFLLELDGAGKCVVASSFSRLVELAAERIRKELRIEVLTLTGKTTDRDREILVKRFSDPSDDARVVIINSKAGGEAITLDAADDMVFFDRPWTSDEYDQVVARVHRVSRIHNVMVHNLASAGTVDEWISSLNDEQRRILRSIRPESAELAKEAFK